MSASSAGTPSGIAGPTFGTAGRWEPPSRSAVVSSFFAILVMALSLGPSFAHLLEAPPRLTAWPPELWREATVFHGQFAYFAIVGAPLDVGAIVLGAIMTVVVRRRRPAFRLAMAGTILFAVSLATWISVVARRTRFWRNGCRGRFRTTSQPCAIGGRPATSRSAQSRPPV